MNMSSREAFIHKHMPCGMEVFLQEQSFAPVVTVHICVGAGSLDEGEGEKGMAHVLEHMLFKGTKSHPEPGSVARLVEAAGGDVNAYTTFDRTVYMFSAPSAFTQDGTALLLEMVSEACLDETEHKRETEVIVEEIHRGNDNPGTLLSRALLAHAYTGTEMARPVIGSTVSVRDFSTRDVRAFYEKWYTPTNMKLIAAGDFDAKALFAFLEKKTAHLAPKPIPERNRPPVQAVGKHRDTPDGLRFEGPALTLRSGPYQDVRLQIALRAPTLEDDSLASWDCLFSLLGQGDSSRLSHVIRDEKQLVTAIDAGLYAPQDPAGMASLGFYTMAEKVEPALTESLAVLVHLAHSEPSEDEIRRVHTALKAERIYARETVEGFVRQTLGNLLTKRGLDFEEHYLHALSRVTPKSVQKAAQKALFEIQAGRWTLSTVFAAEHSEQMDEAALRAIVENAVRDLDFGPASIQQQTGKPGSRKSQPAFQSSPLLPAVKQLVLQGPGGRTLHVNIRKTEKIPAVSFGLFARGGQMLEGQAPAGSNSILAQMLTRGTESLSYRDFVTDLENRAASISAFSGRDIFGIRADCLSEEFEHVCRLLFDCAFRPSFKDDEFRKVQRENIEIARANRDRPGSRLARLAHPLFYGDHPYSRPLPGTEESLAAVRLHEGPHALKTLWCRQLEAPHWIFALSGDFDEDALALMLEELFLEGLEAARSQGVAESASETFRCADAPICSEAQVGFEAFEREQAHIMLGFRGPTLQDENRIVTEVATTILSGMGGRLFSDLREKRSLAYSVHASQSLALHGGLVVTNIGTSSDKSQEAVEGLLRHLGALAREKVSAEELARAKASLLGGQALDSQSLSYQCSQLAYSDAYGLGYDHFLKFRERVNAVTPERILKVMKKSLETSPPVLAIVGPETTWKPDAKDLTWFS